MNRQVSGRQKGGQEGALESAGRLSWSAAQENRGLLALAASWRVLFRLLPVQVPLLTGALIDGLSGNPVRVWGWLVPVTTPAEAVTASCIALAILALATGLTAFCSARTSGALQKRVTADLRRRVLEAWHHASLALHRRYGAAALYDRTLVETRAIGTLLKESVVEGVAAFARLAYPAAMLLLIDPWMALLPLAVLPLQGLLTRLVQTRQGAVADLIREKKSRLRRSVQEALQGIETVQALGAQPSVLERIEADAEALNEERGQSGAYASLMTAAVWAMPGLAVAGSWFLGGSRVLSGEISSGQLVAFAGFVAYLGVPLRRFARLARTTREAMQSLRRVSHLLNAAGADLSRQGSATLRPVRGEVRFVNVVAGDAAQPVLRGVNCTVAGGEFLWLRGGSGVGKSTLLKLLAAMDSPISGRIEVDGQCLDDCSADSVRRAVALVPQQPMVFTGTVAENLRLAAPGCTDETLRDACRRAGLGAWLDALPEGLLTPLGDHGVRLSGGEAQRLSVARALLRQPKVLLLDEPTAALDPAAEEQLLATLAALSPEVTVILVAHRLRSLRGIHRVLQVENGLIAEGSSFAHPHNDHLCLPDTPGAAVSQRLSF